MSRKQSKKSETDSSIEARAKAHIDKVHKPEETKRRWLLYGPFGLSVLFLVIGLAHISKLTGLVGLALSLPTSILPSVVGLYWYVVGRNDLNHYHELLDGADIQKELSAHSEIELKAALRRAQLRHSLIEQRDQRMVGIVTPLFASAVGVWVAATPVGDRHTLLPVVAFLASLLLVLRITSIWAVEKASCIAKLIEYTIDTQKPSDSVEVRPTIPADLSPTLPVDYAGSAAQSGQVVPGNSNMERDRAAKDSDVVLSGAASK